MTGLFDLDEGFYGAVVSEMNTRGEWITPYYNGKPWFEKPILLYWAAKPCVALFGTQFGCRLPSVLATLGIYAVTGQFVRRYVSEHAAMLSVLMLGGSLLVIGCGRMMITDPILVLCLTGAMTTFWDSLQGDVRKRWWTAALLGFAVLAKGPVALILFAFIGAITFARLKDLRPAFRGGWLVGTLILCAVIATWYLPAYLVNGQVFVKEFLIDQNIGRFTGGDAAHSIGIVGLLIFPLVILLGLLPWSGWLPKAWWASFKSKDQTEVYCGIWATVVFVFFTISGAKLVHYILPAFPPLVFLLSKRLDKPASGYLLGGKALCLGMSVIANFAFLLLYSGGGQLEAHTAMRWIRSQNLGKLEVSVYRIGRQEADRGTGSTTLRETSLPSLVLELGQPLRDTESLREVAQTRFMLTRKGRITPERQKEFEKIGVKLELQAGLTKPGNFEVYRVVPLDRF